MQGNKNRKEKEKIDLGSLNLSDSCGIKDFGREGNPDLGSSSSRKLECKLSGVKWKYDSDKVRVSVKMKKHMTEHHVVCLHCGTHLSTIHEKENHLMKSREKWKHKHSDVGYSLKGWLLYHMKNHHQKCKQSSYYKRH